MLYQLFKLINGIWVLVELKIQFNNFNFMVSWYNYFDVYVRMFLEYVDIKEMVRKLKLKIYVYLVFIGENVQKINIKIKLRYVFFIKLLIMFFIKKNKRN